MITNEADTKIRGFLRKVALSGIDYELGNEAIDLLIALEKIRPCMVGSIGTNPVQYAHIIDLLSKGKKIEAIKALRGYTNCGLREGKEAVDFLETQMPSKES